MKIEWSVRAFREGDEEGIYKLYQAVYPSEQTDRDSWMRWWRWMYKNNPNGSQIWVADHNGRIVGQYPIVFMPMKVGHDILIANQNIDLMTHPAYRHQGMFATLERSALEDLGKQEKYITIGFPNEAAYPGHKKSGWFDVSTMKTVFKPLNWKNTIKAKMKIKNKLLSESLAIGAALIFDKILFRVREAPDVDGLTISQVTTFDERFDGLWARVSKQYPIMVVRHKDYLNWRFSGPDTRYWIFAAEKADEVHGYLVLRNSIIENVKISVIFDMIADSEDVMHCLISEAVKVCRQAGVDYISYYLIDGRAYNRVLRSNGFITVPFMKGNLFCVYSSATQISKTFLQDPKNWLIQLVDSDEL